MQIYYVIWSNLTNDDLVRTLSMNSVQVPISKDMNVGVPGLTVEVYTYIVRTVTQISWS